MWDNLKDATENIIDKKIQYNSKNSRRRKKLKSSSNDTNTMFINYLKRKNNLTRITKS